MLGRCVLIATPNKGSVIVAKALKYSRPVAYLFRPLGELQQGGSDIPPPVNIPAPDMGAIAGDSNTAFLGRWLIKGDNDGRVSVASVRFKEMKDFRVLSFDHHRIHHKEKTALLVHQFLQTGCFDIP